MSSVILYAAVIVVGMTSVTLLVNRDWRWSVLSLAVQYLGVFVLVWVSWPIEMAAAILVVGWMAGAALGSAHISPRKTEVEQSWPSSLIFRLLGAGLVLVVSVTIVPVVQGSVPSAQTAQVWGCVILIGMGLLHLGMTASPFRVILGLLTLLSGFEIIYSSVETSLLVAGLLSVISLGLALVGGYMLSLSGTEAAS